MAVVLLNLLFVAIGSFLLLALFPRLTIVTLCLAAVVVHLLDILGSVAAAASWSPTNHYQTIAATVHLRSVWAPCNRL